MVLLYVLNNEIRFKLMKINDRFKVEEVVDVIKYYIYVINRRVMIEYIMI